MSAKSLVGGVAAAFLPTCLAALWPAVTLAQPTAPHQDAIAALSCASVSRQGVYGAGWGSGRSPYGIAYEQWTKGDFAALNRRSQECGNSGTVGYVDHLASMARDPAADTTTEVLRQQRTAYLAAQTSQREASFADAERRARAQVDQYAAAEAARVARESAAEDTRRRMDQEQAARNQAEQARLEAEAEAAEKAGHGPLVVDCKDPALLRRVKSTLEKNPKYGGNLSVLKLYDPSPNGLFQMLMSGGALQRARAMQTGLSIPQCDVKAVTNVGQVTLSFRVFKADDETFVEVSEKTI